MRILHCIPTLGGGGAERQVRLLAPEFARRGVDVALLTRFSAQDCVELSDHGVTCLNLGNIGNHSVRLLTAFNRTVGNGRWQIVQSWLAQMDVLVGLRSLHADFRWVLSERSSAMHYATGWKNKLRRKLGSHADLLIANSMKGASYWQNKNVACTIIPNAIDFSKTAAKPAAVARAGLVPRPTLMSIGRLDQWKNFESLIRAQSVLRTKGRPTQLVILGDGPLRKSLMRLVDELDLRDCVELPGFVLDVSDSLASADVYISTSLYEGQPNAVLEAASARVPLVLSNIEEHTELFRSEAVFVNPLDPLAIAAGIERRLDHYEQAVHDAELAYARIEKHSIDAVITRYLDCYAELLRSTDGRL